MRVFDIYWFNIADKVKFKDTQPYLKNMLAELGLSWSDLDFAASIVDDDPMTEKILKNFPRLKKYYHPVEIGEISATICSYTENWFSGELFCDKSDYDDVFTLFSKIPRPLNISDGHILLNGVNWFGEESLPPIPYNLEGRNVSRLTYYVCYYSNYIVQYRGFDDGLKRNEVSVCIETTAASEPRDSSAILEKLIPYLGKPVETNRTCVFSKEECQKYDDLPYKQHSKYLKGFMENILPIPKKRPYIARSLPPIPHLADITTMKKAFAGTGFTHKKGNPGYMGEYDCRDSHGYLYQAYVQKLSDWRTFRIWLEISGYNFTLSAPGLDYSMEEEGESLPILRAFALLCAKIRDEYGDKLAADFGDTPEWYYKY